MNIAVLGTGMVGTSIASKLVELGHQVKMGSRSATNEKAAAWVAEAGEGASQGTFADAAAFGAMVFNCTAGMASLQALEAAGPGNLAGKILIDLANPLDFSQGMPPRLAVCNDNSLGEQIQAAFPDAKVVKTLNTVNCYVMVDPSRVPGQHDMFLCGNDADAKAEVQTILRDWFGWQNLHDLGDITNARATEAYLPLWVRLWGALGTADFNVHITKAEASPKG